MSAIWGAINLTGDAIEQKDIDILKNGFSDCVLDRIEEVVHGNIYMGCGVQYFTKEAQYEVLPIADESKGLYFDADVVLDNRNELLKMVGSNENKDSMPDGTIMFHILKKDVNTYLNTMLGAYSFAYYDANNNCLCIATDAVGNRCLYYRQIENVVYYSTLIEPLAKVHKAAGLNEKWIADFLALDNLGISIEIEDTLYEGIYKLAPAQIITWDKLHKTKRTYWEPYKTVNERVHLSDEECKKELVHIWNEAVNCTLRANGETAILLSGGLDSTSVACFAARQLKNQGKVLHSYTSVPVTGYQSQQTQCKSEDESQAVKETKQFLKNMTCTFISMDDKNPWEDRKRYLSHEEIPYKSLQNIMWIEEAMSESYHDGARIMLTGSYGNVAFSYGDFSTYMNTLLSKGKIIRFLKELKNFQSYFRYSRKDALKRLLKEYFEKEEIEKLGKEVIGKSYIRKEFMKQYDCQTRLGQYTSDMKKKGKTYQAHRKYLCNYSALSQIGQGYTKSSLYTGVLERDPTRDKRLIEFCMSVPMHHYVRDGIERRLVNVYLKEYLPPHISNESPYGVQSADMKYRLHTMWETVKKEWMEIYTRNIDSRYVDCNKAFVELENMKFLDESSNFDLLRHMYTLLMLEKLDCIENTTVL